MMNTTNKKYQILISPIFILGLAALFLNDHYLKYQFPSWYTGKLSDFLGLFLFGLFWIVIIPNRQRKTLIIIGLLLAFWKSPLSSPIIVFLNNIMPFTIARTIDYTDLSAILVLPLCLKYHNNYERKNIKFRWFYVLPSIFIFCSTSVVKPMIDHADKLVVLRVDSIDYHMIIKKQRFENFMTNATEMIRKGSILSHFEELEYENDTLKLYYNTFGSVPNDTIKNLTLYVKAKFKVNPKNRNKIILDLVESEALVRKDNIEKDMIFLLDQMKREIKSLENVKKK